MTAPSSPPSGRPGASRVSSSQHPTGSSVHGSSAHGSSAHGSSVHGSGVHRAPDAPRRGFLTGLLARTTLTMLLTSLVPVAVFGAVSLYLQSERLRVDAETSLRASGARIAREVDEWFDKTLRAAEATATLPGMTGMRAEEHLPINDAIRKAYPWIHLIHVVGPNGWDVSRSDGKALANYSERSYYRRLMGGEKNPVWETVQGKTSGKPTVNVAVPIVNAQRVVGILVLSTTVEYVSKVLAEWKIGQTGFAFLTDDENKVMAHPRQEYVKNMTRIADNPLVAAYRKDPQPHLLAFRSDGKDVLGYVQGSRWNWAVAIQRDQDELYAPLRQTLYLGVGLLAAVALLVAIAAWAASRMLVRPIVGMSTSADRMSTGHLEDAIPSQRIDELSMLARSLDRLRISLRAAMARLRG